jgi:hypothetical protein
MIEHSLKQSASQADSNSHSPVLPANYESVSMPMTKDNKSTLQSSNTSSMHHNQPAVTKLEKKDIPLKSTPILR